MRETGEEDRWGGQVMGTGGGTGDGDRWGNRWGTGGETGGGQVGRHVMGTGEADR